MYSLGLFSNDEVVELIDIPQSCAGAPCPMVMGDEQQLAVIFYLEDTADGWGDTGLCDGDAGLTNEAYATISFDGAHCYYHGAPNDEAFAGHPLAKKGLAPYGAFEVKNSSWIRQSMERNRVHPDHRDEAFRELRHFVLSFHDTIFECVARGYQFELGQGSILSGAQIFLSKLQDESK